MNNLEQDMLRDNQIYLNKIELGRKIAAIIDEGVLLQESLTMKRKEALDLYIRSCQKSKSEDCSNDNILEIDETGGSDKNDMKSQHLRKTYCWNNSSVKHHIISQIPPTVKKKWPTKRCVICKNYGICHESRYYCKRCNVALCKNPCFKEYHSII